MYYLVLYCVDFLIFFYLIFLPDVRGLVGDDDLLNKGALDIFHTYNVEQLIPVDVPDKETKVFQFAFFL